MTNKMNFIYRLKPEDLEKASKAIVLLFPTEHEATYYLKAQNSRNPAGKLRDAYHNLRTNLQSVGLIAKRTYKKKKLVVAADGKNKF